MLQHFDIIDSQMQTQFAKHQMGVQSTETKKRQKHSEEELRVLWRIYEPGKADGLGILTFEKNMVF